MFFKQKSISNWFMKYRLEKVVVSVGLGGKTPSEINERKKHFEKLISGVIGKDRKALTTVCKKSNAVWKIRKNNPIGLKITLRGPQIGPFKSLKMNWKYDTNSLYKGVHDHRGLKFEKYNTSAPDYGLGIRLIFGRYGSRIKYRRIKQMDLKDRVPEAICRGLLT